MGAAGVREEGIGGLKRGFGIGQKGFAGRGHNDLAGGALDELHAEPLLERHEPLGEGRLRDLQLGGSGAEVLVFCHGDKRAQLGKCWSIFFIMHAYHSNIYL